MKQTVRPEAVNEYSGEVQWSRLGACLVLMLMRLLGPLGLAYRVLVGLSELLGVAYAELKSRLRSRHPESGRNQFDIQPRLVLAREEVGASLNLAIKNRSRLRVWVEAAQVDLTDLQADWETFAPTGQSILKIRQFVGPSERLHVSLVEAVYNAAGRPQGVYSCLVSTVLRYRAQDDKEEFDKPLAVYRLKMIKLVPIGLRQMRWYDRLATSRGSADAPAPERKQQSNRVRRSQRAITQSVVVVEGTCSDGRPYLDATRALVLSAHGCLVTLTNPVRLGESVVVRNISTLQKQHCQVVYIGEKHEGRTQVGLGFETSAPEFWDIDCLPSIGR